MTEQEVAFVEDDELYGQVDQLYRDKSSDADGFYWLSIEPADAGLASITVYESSDPPTKISEQLSKSITCSPRVALEVLTGLYTYNNFDSGAYPDPDEFARNIFPDADFDSGPEPDEVALALEALLKAEIIKDGSSTPASSMEEVVAPALVGQPPTMG